MSKVDAHWELIEAIKTLRDEIAPNTLLTINGDIPDEQTGLELASKYGIDGIMIGRGSSITHSHLKGTTRTFKQRIIRFITLTSLFI